MAASFKEFAAARRFDILSLDRGELRRQDKLFELANFERNYVANLQTLKARRCFSSLLFADHSQSRVIEPLRTRGLFAQGDMDALFR